MAATEEKAQQLQADFAAAMSQHQAYIGNAPFMIHDEDVKYLKPERWAILMPIAYGEAQKQQGLNACGLVATRAVQFQAPVVTIAQGGGYKVDIDAWVLRDAAEINNNQQQEQQQEQQQQPNADSAE